MTSTASGSEPAEETCVHSQSPPGSQAPLENWQETLDFKQTLMDMNKNMSTMATLLQQLAQPGPSGFAQRANSNKVPRKRKLTASEKMHKHTQMPPAKAPKEYVASNDDNVSVHASDSEYGDTDSEADPCPEDDNHSTFSLEKAKEKLFSLPQSDEALKHSEAEEEKFLESLSKSFETSEKATAEITPHLADIANKRWDKKLAPEVLKTLLGRHGKPANCTSVTNVNVNPEIWGQLNAGKRTKDLRQSNTHQTLQRVTFIILEMADCLLNRKDSELDKISLVSNAVDSIALLGHVENDITTFRREQIKSALREEYRQLCSANIALREWLFGEDLPKCLREIKETNCLAQEVAINSTGKSIMATQIANITPQEGSIVQEIKALLFMERPTKAKNQEQTDELPSREKLLSLLEETKQSVSTFEEHLPNIESQLKNECDNFQAGRVAQFYENWRELRHNQEILRDIHGANIECNTTPQQHKLSRKQFSEDDTMIIESKVEKLLSKGVIEPAQHEQGETSQTYSLGLKQMAHTG